MRTKNAKRLWPVPVTLGVMALAALLAFGLMATNGAQPAAAQDDPDCEVEVAIASNGTATATVIDGFSADEEDCRARGGTATIRFTGPATAPAGVDDPGKLDLLIQDDNGPIRAYVNGTVDFDAGNADPNNRYEITGPGATAGLGTQDEEAPSPMRWRIERVEVPLPARDAQGQVKAQSADVTVSGNVYIFGPDAAVTSAITGVPEDFSDKRDETVSRNEEQTVTILFLGEASLGEDGDDINDTLDDVEQCVVANSDPPREVMREAGQTSCPSSPASTVDTDDDPESRSKLFVVTDDSTAAPTKIIGARTETHEMTGNSGRESVTIYAVLQDADENPLTGIDVDFTASPTPNDIVAPRDLVDDDETAAFGSDVAVTGIAVTDAVATFQVEGLPTNISYVVSVEVMAGDFSLGTVEIARKGDATKVIAGVFNAACFDPAGTADEPNYANATFDADAKGCDASGMANHFGHGEMIFVKAHHEDDLDLIVGDGDDLSAKLANEDDDLLGEAKAVLIEDPVMPGDPARAWIFTIDDEASLGERMITVSTSVEDEDGDDLDSVTLAITVAGPPHTYSVDGPEYIGLGESGTFTVTAVDEEGGLPYFTTVDDDATSADERNDRVSVFVADVPAGNVRGLTSGDDLVLDTDTGMGTFTVYAPRDAGQGELARIFVSEGDSEVSGSVTFGEEPPENVAPVAPVVPLGQAMDLTATANADGSITLMFTPGTSATHHFVSGNVSVIWEYAGGMNMHTVPADQLTSGMEYKFYVLSGQWEEMADGTWEGMWAAEGWSNVAMSTAN